MSFGAGWSTGWKHVRDFDDLNRTVVCELAIPDAEPKVAVHRHYWRTGRAFVVAIEDAVAGVSVWDPMLVYVPGEWIVSPNGYDGGEVPTTFARGLHYFSDRAHLAFLKLKGPDRF
jgi:hypothetical protein